jgi:hypothetical protein
MAESKKVRSSRLKAESKKVRSSRLKAEREKVGKQEVSQELFSSPFQGCRDNAVADSKVFSPEFINKWPNLFK